MRGDTRNGSRDRERYASPLDALGRARDESLEHVTRSKHDTDRARSLFEEILFAPDRDQAPGVRPVLSFSEQDDPDYLAAIEARTRTTVELWRRGLWHGAWAELERESDRDPIEIDFPTLSQRWHAARPLVLHGVAAEALPNFEREIASAADLHAALAEPGGLKRWLAGRASDLGPEFHVLARRAPLFDAERDIERVRIESLPPSGRGKRVQDLWVKSSWLSTHADDDSLRLRVSFGRERVDDASGDGLRHRLVAALASALLPECALASANPAITTLVERLCAQAILFTQHIAYWNGPEGGALFHHDAFADDSDVAGRGQLGVCHLQLAGRTAWLALSVRDLAVRVREFAECLEEGELPWVRAQLFPDRAVDRRFFELVRDEQRMLRELALPGCGALGALVNRGPEFTAFLADAGHAFVLEAGDAVLLPNHGLDRTAMHSVFCASEETAYSLSLAMRSDRPDRDLPLDIEGPAAGSNER